jgi:hypothetical protein
MTIIARRRIAASRYSGLIGQRGSLRFLRRFGRSPFLELDRGTFSESSIRVLSIK